MKTRYKYIHMKRLTARSGDKFVWNIYNNKSKDVLGGIAWYSPWQQYCFYAKEGSIYNDGCLSDIQDFIKQLTNEEEG